MTRWTLGATACHVCRGALRLCAGIDSLERADQGLAAVQRHGVARAPLVLLAVGVEETVVGLRRLPAVDHEKAPLFLQRCRELRPEVAVGAVEEARPFAARPVRRDEVVRAALLGLVLEHHRDHGRDPTAQPRLTRRELSTKVADAMRALP